MAHLLVEWEPAGPSGTEMRLGRRAVKGSHAPGAARSSPSPLVSARRAVLRLRLGFPGIRGRPAAGWRRRPMRRRWILVNLLNASNTSSRQTDAGRDAAVPLPTACAIAE